MVSEHAKILFNMKNFVTEKYMWENENDSWLIVFPSFFAQSLNSDNRKLTFQTIYKTSKLFVENF